MTPLERSIEPPGREPFSSTIGEPPSSRARAAAHRPAIPPPAMSIYVRENEGLCSTYSTLTRSGPQTKTA